MNAEEEMRREEKCVIRGILCRIRTPSAFIRIWYSSTCDSGIDVVDYWISRRVEMLSHGPYNSSLPCLISLLQYYMTDLHFINWEYNDQSESGYVTTMNNHLSGPLSNKPTFTWQEDGRWDVAPEPKCAPACVIQRKLSGVQSKLEHYVSFLLVSL